ncbi:MAG TPA: ABC transporter ATP-binding protein [Xanthobacteraceae bacterium]|jgi:ABC-type branched-subunit amino acid transport system ATPase component
MLEARGIEIAYGAFEVLHQVEISVGPQRIVGLFGHNGAGKSSLLKGIYGLLHVRSGTVTFAGEETTNDRPFEQVMRGMRLVPQESNVFPNLSVEDNLRLGALRLAGGAREEAARFEDVYGTFPILCERRRQRASVLSGGERQMLAISTALMTRPRLLLLDEPSAGLAPILVQRLFQMIRLIRERFGMSVLLVEQNVTEALRIVDEVCVLEEGRVVFTGAADAREEIVRCLWRLRRTAETAQSRAGA